MGVKIVCLSYMTKKTGVQSWRHWFIMWFGLGKIYPVIVLMCLSILWPVCIGQAC